MQDMKLWKMNARINFFILHAKKQKKVTTYTF